MRAASLPWRPTSAGHPRPAPAREGPANKSVHAAGSARAARPWSRHLQCLAVPAQDGVIWHRQVQAEEADDRSDQTLGLAQRKMKHRSQRQCRQDGERRIARLSAAIRPRLGAPAGNRLVAEPYREIATLPQARIIGRSIRQPAPLLWNMVATAGVGFEWHGGIRGKQPSSPPSATAKKFDPCINVTNVVFQLPTAYNIRICTWGPHWAGVIANWIVTQDGQSRRRGLQSA